MTANHSLTIRAKVHFGRGEHGRLQINAGESPSPHAHGRLPRVTRLLALAIRFDQLIHEGKARNYAELAEAGHVTRPRMTQVMNLLNLAPDIQEALLFMPPAAAGKDNITERQIRTVLRALDWDIQRNMWARYIKI